MNATPSPDGRSDASDDQGDSDIPPCAVPLPDSVPQQKKREVGATRRAAPGADPLEDTDPRAAAQAAAVENLLRCWVRETGLTAPTAANLRVPLPASGTALIAPVRYWSPTGWHRFGPPRLAYAPDTAPPVDAVTLAALLSRESADAPSVTPRIPTSTPPDPTDGTAPDCAESTALDCAEGTAPGCADGAVSDPAEGTVPGCADGAVSDPAEGTVPDCADGAAPDRTEGTVPDCADGAAPDRTEDAAPDCAYGATPDPAQYAAPGLADGDAPGTTPGFAGGSIPRQGGGTSPASTDSGVFRDPGDLVARVADSVRRTADFIRHRREHPADTADLFLSAEQALLLGHPLHPAPKSREGMTDAEGGRYSPESRGSFPLHWLAVAPSLLAADSAWTERGRPVPAEQLIRRVAGADLPLPDGYTALPLHPWQAREVRHRASVAALLDSGLLHDLGPLGTPWHPTSSVRTVHRSGAPAMLKLSLALPITNSRRENLRKELHRGVEVHRLLRTGLAEQWQSAHPGFGIVRDPAWLAVDGPDGLPVPGLDVMIRHNPFSPADDVGCVAGLVSPRPLAVPPADATPRQSVWPARSRLALLLARLAGRTGRPVGAVAAEWFLRYLEHVVRPVLWLDSEAGIALEAHQQNTLLLLDGDGWPAGGRYRDNQGYYFRESRRAELSARLPGIGERSDTFVSDEVTDERFAYYLAVNNVFGLIGAFGSQRLADERLLLAAFRRFLTALASGPAPLRAALPGHLLDSPVLRCKANLLTRLHGLDELVGPVDTQSVYVTIANPLHS
ncbi:IucA/IucC family protein [Streptomyces echinatus]|uniref:Siderophore synthetase component n=1 Tax=Streptomyces echinatus TaxID=67293 RepID=A0A7W9PXX2_9ACTN|nr:IucA/IucC family protein [Streptomyces echinatus]MBB5929995.1 siderophore synthetase component [Streptomyces echinatus]